MRSGYLVFFRCPAHVIHTGASRFVIEEGEYVYVGSCGISCIKRVLRHMRRPDVRRWHVDYLQCRSLYAVISPKSEREIAMCLEELCTPVRGFGSTDSPQSLGHLFKCDVDVLNCA